MTGNALRVFRGLDPLEPEALVITPKPWDGADVYGNNAYFNNLLVKGQPVGGVTFPLSAPTTTVIDPSNITTPIPYTFAGDGFTGWGSTGKGFAYLFSNWVDGTASGFIALSMQPWTVFGTGPGSAGTAFSLTRHGAFGWTSDDSNATDLTNYYTFFSGDTSAQWVALACDVNGSGAGLRIYGQYPKSSPFTQNYWRLNFDTLNGQSTGAIITTEYRGGSPPPILITPSGFLSIGANGQRKWTIDPTVNSGNTLQPFGNNTFDIGALGLALRTIYTFSIQFMTTIANTATAGGAPALPATPAGYFLVTDSGGTQRKIPAYNV